MPIALIQAASAVHSALPAGSASKAMPSAKEAHRHRGQHAARQRVRRDQAWHETGVRNHRQRGDLGHKTHHQYQRAVGAEPAVAHDLQLCRGIATAAEPVGDIGQAVLVQRAGQDRAHAQGERRHGEVWHADRAQAETDKAHRAADRRADQRKRPLRAGKIHRHRPRRMRHRQPGQEGDRGSEVVEPVIHAKKSGKSFGSRRAQD